MKTDSIQDLKSFENQIFDKVQEYLDNPYPEDATLGICNETKEIVIDSENNINGKFDKYKITTLIRTDEQNKPEPDCDAIYELASNYYFVR